MCRDGAIILLTFVAQAFAKDVLTNQTDDVQEFEGKVTKKLVDKLFQKSSHLKMPSHRSLQGLLPHALPHSNPSHSGLLPGNRMQEPGFAGLRQSSHTPNEWPVYWKGNKRKDKWRGQAESNNFPSDPWPNEEKHRWIPEDDPTSTQLPNGYIPKTPQEFHGTRAKGFYPGTSRVHFTLPGKEDELKTIEILRSQDKGNPSFGAVKVRIPLEASVISKDGCLVVQEVRPGSHADLSKLRPGDIIRAMSAPFVEGQKQVDLP